MGRRAIRTNHQGQRSALQPVDAEGCLRWAPSSKGKVELKIGGYPNAGQAVAPDLEILRHSAKARSREARRKFAVADSG